MRNVFLLILSSTALLSAADLPYAGKWKMNPAKSDFGELTCPFADLGSGELQFTMDGQSYKFKTDGKEYPALMGQTAAWKQVDANTWEIVNKLNGKVMSTDTDKLSADGKTLTYNTRMNKPGGGTAEESMTFTRASGASGLAGKWKAKNYKSSSPETMELSAFGDDGLRMAIVDYQLTCEAKFDGKDYDCTGPTIAKGWTMSVKKSGSHSFEFTDKKDGKLLYEGSMTVSADGKTLTEIAAAQGTNEKMKAVYEKQ